MKKILFLLILLSASVTAFGQANPPLRVKEADNDPNVVGVTTLVFSNGSVSCAGKVCTITTGGGSAGGSDTQIQYNNAGALGGVSGATSNGTAITFTANNLIATSPRFVTGINDTNGNELFLLTATASAVNELTYANAATGNRPTFTASGGDTNIGIGLTTKGSGTILMTTNNGASLTTTAIGTGMAVSGTTSPVNSVANTGTNGGTFVFGVASGTAAFTPVALAGDAIFRHSASSGNGRLIIVNGNSQRIIFSTGAQDADIEKMSIAGSSQNVYFGNGETATSPAGSVLNGTGGSGTNVAGATLTIAGGKGTGNAASGLIVFQTSDAGGSGTTLQTLTTKLTMNRDGGLLFAGVTQANLGTPTNGTIVYCSDCTIANPCAGGGSGALAKRLNGVWVCN